MKSRFVLVATLLVSLCGTATAYAEKPDVVIFNLDDIGFDCSIGSVGNLGEEKFFKGTELLPTLEGAPITSPIYAREACGFIDRAKTEPVSHSRSTQSPF